MLLEHLIFNVLQDGRCVTVARLRLTSGPPRPSMEDSWYPRCDCGLHRALVWQCLLVLFWFQVSVYLVKHRPSPISHSQQCTIAPVAFTAIQMLDSASISSASFSSVPFTSCPASTPLQHRMIAITTLRCSSDLSASRS